MRSQVSQSEHRWLSRRKRRRETKLTGVCHELEGSAEVAVASCRTGAHVEDVGSERRETFNVGVSGRRLDDPVASLVLVLRWTTGGRQLNKTGKI